MDFNALELRGWDVGDIYVCVHGMQFSQFLFHIAGSLFILIFPVKIILKARELPLHHTLLGPSVNSILTL